MTWISYYHFLAHDNSVAAVVDDGLFPTDADSGNGSSWDVIVSI